MNAPVRFVEQHARHRFTADEVMRMVDVGVIDQDARIELLDGELVDMPSEGELHVTLKILLNRFLVKAVADDLWVAPDATLHLAASDAPEPDLYILKAAASLKPIGSSDVLLVIEIADTSIDYDLGRKAGKYASYGLVEYWVVDAQNQCTHVLRVPERDAYHDITSVPFDQPLTPTRLPDIALVIADLAGLKLD